MNLNAGIKKLELIVNFLSNGRKATWEEILEYIEKQERNFQFGMTGDGNNLLAKSKRTFQRDKKSISKYFGIDIEYDRKEKVYFIANRDDLNIDYSRIFELSEVMKLLQASELNKEYIQLEQKAPKGIAYINQLIAAMRKKKAVWIHYKKYSDTIPKKVLVNPYLIMEDRNRWYIITKNEALHIKTYALDRIQDLEITNFNTPSTTKEEILAPFQYSYGITSHLPQTKAPEIILEFTWKQALFIKALPLHPQQKIVSENKEEDSCIISIPTVTSQELIMDILSFGDCVKVLSPQSLAHEIKNIANNISKLYK